ncbi:hypothetical protein [Ideonella sp. BN130291]|uniref:hypothetical protein n=1 Tax=Ideonella sp. BN130291 TaxID=3112940 RepID=UPI002E26ED6A|nr:hypothetical protein [Ideonella sp. BN130291]
MQQAKQAAGPVHWKPLPGKPERGLLTLMETRFGWRLVDCADLFDRQLAEIASLAKALQAPLLRPTAQTMFQQLCNRSVVHVQAREQFLLPAWRRAHWKHLPSDALATHMEFKRALADLMLQRPGSEHFNEALAAFVATVEVHRRSDRDRLVPALREAIDLADRRQLCNDIEVLYEAGASSTASLSLNQPFLSSRDLIEEAEVVLSSILQPGQAGRGAEA